MPARIAEGTTVGAASVGVREDTECVCVSTCCHTWKRVGKNMGPCVAVLCVDVDTVHGCCKTTGLRLFRSKQVAAQEMQSEAKRSRKQKHTE